MGNDPFANSSPEETGLAVAKEFSSEGQTTATQAETGFKYADESSQIIIKLDLAEKNIAAQKDEIISLRRELDELKNRVNTPKDDPFRFWLRFWFPWFSR